MCLVFLNMSDLFQNMSDIFSQKSQHYIIF